MSAASTVAIAGLLVAIAAGVGGYGYGLDQGKALEKGRRDADSLKTVTDQISAHGDLVKQSGVASRNLRLAVAAREKVNDTTSKELGDALIDERELFIRDFHKNTCLYLRQNPHIRHGRANSNA